MAGCSRSAPFPRSGTRHGATRRRGGTTSSASQGHPRAAHLRDHADAPAAAPGRLGASPAAAPRHAPADAAQPPEPARPARRGRQDLLIAFPEGRPSGQPQHPLPRPSARSRPQDGLNVRRAASRTARAWPRWAAGSRGGVRSAPSRGGVRRPTESGSPAASAVSSATILKLSPTRSSARAPSAA